MPDREPTRYQPADVPRRRARRRRARRRRRRRLRHRPRCRAGERRTSTRVVPFYGAHQAGIATPAQDRLAFAAFDVTSTDRTELQTLLAQWAAAAAQMTKGRPIGSVETAPDNPPIDTGEALGLPAATLTVTVGFGPGLFDDRFGLARHRPAALEKLPRAARRRARARPQRRRPVRAGLRGRSAGGLPRDPQLRSAGARDGRHALVAARVRADVLDLDDAGHPAQPDGLQGRHAQHQGGVGRRDGAASSGSATRPTSRGCAAAATWWPGASGC